MEPCAIPIGSDELNAWYVKHSELLYWDRGFRVDEELKSLGIESHRQIESLGRLIELPDHARHATLARPLRLRYTEQSFETPQQWRQWFEENQERIYFTDVGGYRFKVAPPGHLAVR